MDTERQAKIKAIMDALLDYEALVGNDFALICRLMAELIAIPVIIASPADKGNGPS